MPLLRCERDVLAGVWAAEERGEGNCYVYEEKQLDGVDGVARVRCVADDLDGDAERMLARDPRLIRSGDETYEKRYGCAMKVKTMTAAFSTTMRESPGLKQLEFWRRTISSMRGCCHLPGVETAGEALYAREGEPFCGVREATGCARTFFAFVAGDCECNCK